MSTKATPSVTRGDITLQPSFFTSSLFVYPLKEDISRLIQAFTDRYHQSDKKQPFSLFKQIWNEQGWPWMHLKVFDGRARARFIEITTRLLAERMEGTENILTRTVSLFAMYTFYFTQPSTSAPSLYSCNYIPIPIDTFQCILEIPSLLSSPELQPLQPYATYTLSKLLDSQCFHILPHSELRAQNPAILPREIFVPEGSGVIDNLVPSGSNSIADTTTQTAKPTKKKGRPSKREKAKRTRDAVNALDKWLDKVTYTYPQVSTSSTHMVPIPGIPGPVEMSPMMETTHTLIAHAPSTSRDAYMLQKNQLLEVLDPRTLIAPVVNPIPGGDALKRANEAVLTRLQKIDEMAAEKGLEVGGECGEMTGLARVEKAVQSLKEGSSRGGILNLLEGAGTGSAQEQVRAARQGPSGQDRPMDIDG
ncbi:hypothetical protein C8Q75DRAFT_236324 [Abortiporus biennis]|nr:hypothetical protein C8Q75DRAFT_236324 [Abortiporus biennis]